jgi:hypothetical protein
MAITHSYDELQPEEDLQDQQPRPDVVSMLKADHDVIESLFAQCEEATGDASADTQQLFPQIFQLLLLHARLEEELVYPLARTQLYESDDLLLHEFEETHAEVNELIEQLQGMSQNDSGVMLLLDELIASVRVHIEEAILRTFFERKGVTKKATPCLNMSAQLYSKQGMAYDNCPGHSEADASGESTTTKVSGGAVCHDPGLAGPRHGAQSESLL